MVYSIRVPATTANMGPGFDSIGMALKLYNTYRIEKGVEGIEIHGTYGFPKENNLVDQGIKRVWERCRYKGEGLKITAEVSDIPVSRGLGSSAASIAAGIVIGNKVLGDPLNLNEMIKLGIEIEGHGDNIIPAFVGGMTVSIWNGREAIYSRVKVPNRIKFAVMIPSYRVATAEARKVLPKSYTREDCVFNLSRSALLISAMNNGELDKLRVAMEDRIHQPYRSQLIPNASEIFHRAQNLGSLAEVISGSGATLMAIIDQTNKDFLPKMTEYLGGLGGNWEVKLLDYDEEGIVIR